MDYLDFELEVGLGDGHAYPVAVLHSPAGEARATMTLPFSELELENRLQALQLALLRSASGRRRIASPEAEQVRSFGRTLFESLIRGEVRSRFAVSQREAMREGKGLRLKLRIQPPELAALPWEYLYDPQQEEYVALSHETPLVRYLELPHPPQPLAIAPPLRILGMVASPRDLSALDVEHEKERIERALADAQAGGLISLTWLEGQTWRDLQRAMRQGPWHVFHFIGHGSFSREIDEGFIALADPAGETHRFTATALGRMLSGHRSLRLVVLNACEGAAGSQVDLFASTAATLVRRGIPAVLAMQYEITDNAAIELARTFYEVLAEGAPVDLALSETRKAISFTAANTFEWGTPVLFLRAPDGVLFRLQSASARADAPPARPDPGPHAESGLAPDLYRRLQETLAQCEVFGSDRTLHALFVDSRLAPWRHQLPHAASVAGRVQEMIAFLHGRRQAGSNRSALALLLQVLQDHLDEGDALHDQLGALAGELGADAPLPPPPRPARASGAPVRAARPTPQPAPPEPVETEVEPALEEEEEPEETAGATAPVLLHLLAGYGKQINCLAFSPDSQLLATGSGGDVVAGDKDIRLWRARQGTLERKLTGHGDTVRAVAFAPGGEYLASTGDDKVVRLWTMPTGQPQRAFGGHAGWLGWGRAVAFSPDGTMLVSGGDDKTIRFWRVPDGELLQTLEGHANYVMAVAFSPDGALLASGSYDMTVRLWQMPQGEPLRSLAGHTNRVQAVAFSPDGALLASASDDNTVRLWQMPDGQPLATLQGHGNSVLAIAFSPDGRLLASASYDRTVRLWQMPDGALLHILEGHSDWLKAVAFSPDGALLASAGDDKSVRVWQV